jgi:DNA-binding response OmpR family regulator
MEIKITLGAWNLLVPIFCPSFFKNIMTPELLQRAKILIIDDEATNVHLLEKMLQREGYRNVSTTTDPRHGITMFTQDQPDLVLLDLYMPHINGFEVMDMLNDLTPDNTFLPIIVLTADTSTTTRHTSLDNGAIDFLCKPFDNLEVVLRIRNALRTRFLYLELSSQNQILFDVLPNRKREKPCSARQSRSVEATAPQPS